MAETTIEWTDATWNPVAGCTILSPGCTNCYAMRMAARLDAMGMEKYRGLTRRSAGRAKWTGKIKLDRKVLAVPAQWRRPRRIFVNSMSDLFHESVPIEFVAEVWAVMASTPWHTYQILTKRPARMAEITSGMKKLQNVWLGTSVESADYLDRIDELRKVQATVRFILVRTVARLGCWRRSSRYPMGDRRGRERSARASYIGRMGRRDRGCMS